jgi:hypothetical protein
VSKTPDIAPSDHPETSPALPVFTSAYLKINDDQYLAPAEIRSVDVLDDWIVKAEDAVTEARNGVTAIAWPFALAGMVGFLAMLADVADKAPNIWTSFAVSPYKSGVCFFLLTATIIAIVLSDRTSAERRRLIAIRHAYLRRRRELILGGVIGQEPSSAVS